MNTLNPIRELTFILGAPDPEMNRIERVLSDLNLKFEYAMVNGVRCHPGNAYKADKPAADGYYVEVECEPRIASGRVVARCDHHREGDFGYDLGPAAYWGASSIGQLWALLEKEFTYEELIDAFGEDRFLVAASDHCPVHASLGLCPEVEPHALFNFRMANKARYWNKTLEEVMTEIRESLNMVNELHVKTFVNGDVIDATGVTIPHLPDVITHPSIALPAQYTMVDPSGRTKVGLIGTINPALVEEWMNYNKDKLVDIYGSPARGYAGGYLPA